MLTKILFSNLINHFFRCHQVFSFIITKYKASLAHNQGGTGLPVLADRHAFLFILENFHLIGFIFFYNQLQCNKCIFLHHIVTMCFLFNFANLLFNSIFLQNTPLTINYFLIFIALFRFKFLLNLIFFRILIWTFFNIEIQNHYF